MKKVIRDGKVAVIVSPGYGAGWYSWNKDVRECLFHPTIVELIETKKTEIITNEFCQELFGVDYFYAGGSDQLRIGWLKVGTSFRIDEYDGYESLVEENEHSWITA